MDTSGIRSSHHTQTGSMRKMNNIGKGSTFIEPKDSFQKSEKSVDLGIAARNLFQISVKDNSPVLPVSWEKQVGKEIKGVLMSPDGETMFAAIDGPKSGEHAALAAFDPATGKEKWSFGIDSDFKLNCMEIAKDGKTIFFGKPHGSLIALDTDKKQPTEKWSFTPEEAYVDKPVLSPDGKNLLVFCMGKKTAYGNIFALNPENGEVRWKTPTKSPVCSPPAFSSDGKQLLVKTMGDDISSFSLKDGSPMWDIKTPDNSKYPLQSLDGGKTFLSRNHNKEIISIDAATGNSTVLAAAPDKANELMEISPKNGMIIFRSYKGDLVGVNLRNGKKKWTIELGKNRVSPKLSKDESKMYAADENGTIMAIDPRNGNVIGKYETGDNINSQLNLSPDDKTLFAGNSTGKIVSVQLKEIREVKEQDEQLKEIVRKEKSVIIGGVELPLSRKAI